MFIFRSKKFRLCSLLARMTTHFRQNQVLTSCVRVWSLIHNLCESRTSILSIACQSGVRISLTDSLNCHSPLLRLNIRYLRRRVKEKSTGHQEPLSLVTLPCSGWISRKVTDNAETSDSCINACPEHCSSCHSGGWGTQSVCSQTSRIHKELDQNKKNLFPPHWLVCTGNARRHRFEFCLQVKWVSEIPM